MKAETKRMIGDTIYIFAWIILILSISCGIQQIDAKKQIYCPDWALLVFIVVAIFAIIYLLAENAWLYHIKRIWTEFDHLLIMLSFVAILSVAIFAFPVKLETGIVTARFNDQYVSVKRSDGKIVDGEDITGMLKTGDKVRLKNETFGEGFGYFAIKL